MRAAVTGMGAVTAFGRGTARLWDAMAAGEQGIRRIERFSTEAFDVQIAGVVPDRNDPRWEDPGAALCIELAVDAALEACRAADVAAPPDRIALVLGSSLGDHELPMHEVTRRIADAIGARGPRITVSTACTSSSNALGIGLDLLEQHAADAVIAGGADMLTPMVLAGFHRLGVLSPLPCAPFSHPP
ncbi:MAG TPA: beta-ketoacyl synthase N-terminal-like domain-containing protein, partial [Kofleriaceae bacterium]|nr:beta-ketoacyl synthase N-terminal-like domain-containing protein [Kofleriaceae bacterium]